MGVPKVWDRAPGDPGSWSQGANWDPNGEPTAADSATITNGGIANVVNPNEVADSLTLGVNFGESGTVRANNSGNFLTIDTNIFVGLGGEGTLRITNGADVFASGGFTSVGDLAGSMGRVLVRDSGSGLITGDLYIGYLGDGGLEVLSTGMTGGVLSSNGFIADQAGSMGRVLVADSAFWSMSGLLSVGGLGDGRLDADDVGGVFSNGAIIGAGSGSFGRVDLTIMSLLDATTGALTVGGAGQGRLNISGGSAAQADSYISIGDASGGMGIVRVDTGSFLTTGDVLYVGYLGNGRLEAMGASSITSVGARIGDLSSGIGRAFISGGTGWGNTGDFYVGAEGMGELELSTGGFVGNSGFLSIGDNVGSVGTVLVDGAGSGFANDSGIVYVGYLGDGTLRVTAGGAVSSAGGEIASQSGSIGRASVEGLNSIWFSNGPLYVGGSAAGVGGDGALRIIENGTVIASSVTVLGTGSGDRSALVVDSTYTLSTPALTFDGGILRFIDDTHFTNNANLGTSNGAIGVFVDSNDTTSFLDGVFTGDGGLVKRDEGTIVITNDNNYTGPTRVNNGTLVINGSITSNTFVNSDATLAGDGIIYGNVTANDFSHVTPGTSPGTLTIHGGDYTNNDDALFGAEIGGLNEGIDADLLRVIGANSGMAFINGGFLEVTRFGGFSPSPGDRVTIIRTDSGRFGMFETLIRTGWPGLIQPTDVYDDFTVDILFVLSPFSGVSGLTRNQACVAENLDDAALLSDPDAVALIRFVGNLPMSDLPAAFDLIAPEELASIYEVSFSHAIVQGANFQRRLSDIRVSAMGYCDFGTAVQMVDQSGGKAGDGKTVLTDKNVGPVVETCPDKRWGVFATAVGQWTEVRDNDLNAPGYEIFSGGFTTGVDYRVSSNFAIGIGGGYAHSTAELVNGGEVDVGGGFAGIYATVFTGGFYADLVANAGWNNYDTFRVGLEGDERGSTDGAEFNALVGGGYDWKAGCWTLGPFASFQYTYVEIDSFTEGGASLAPLHYPDQDEDAARSTLGLKIAYEARQGNTILRPEVRVAWQHEFNDTAYAIDWSFSPELVGSDAHLCSVFGPKTGEDSALLDAGFSLIFGRCHNLAAYVYYNGNLGRENYDRHAATGGLRVSF